MHAVLSYVQYVLPSLCRNYSSFFALLLSLNYFYLFQNSFRNLFSFLYILIENVLVHLLIFACSISLGKKALKANWKLYELLRSVTWWVSRYMIWWGNCIGGAKLLDTVYVCLWCICVWMYMLTRVYTYIHLCSSWEKSIICLYILNFSVIILDSDYGDNKSI